MVRTEYHRVDLQILVRRRADGSAAIRIGSPARWYEENIPAADLDDWLQSSTPDWVPLLPRGLPVDRAVDDWQARVRDDVRPAGQGGAVLCLARVTIDVDDPALAVLCWERVFDSMETDKPRVRVSSVRPRAATLPLTFPLRVLQVNRGYCDVPSIMRRVFGSYPDHVVAEAVSAEGTLWGPEGPWLAPAGWPTVEVLHFDWLPTLTLPERLLLSTASPDRPGTLGWFSRWTGIWQTRLMLIGCSSQEEIRAARKLAAALLARGGPAVVVGGFPPPHLFDDGAESFYEQLIHDVPLDAVLGQYRQPLWAGGLDAHGRPTPFCSNLFAGAGREEGLRTSKIGQSLLGLEEGLSGKKSAQKRRQESESPN